MPFKVPSRTNTGGIVNLPPHNYGRATKYMSVQAQLDNVINAANTQFIESLRVDGVQVNYWHRVTEGVFCTCQDSQAGSRPHLQNFSDTFNPNYQNKQGDDSTLPSSNDSLVTFRVRGALERFEDAKNAIDQVFGEPEGTLPESENQGQARKDYNESTSNTESLLSDSNNNAFLKMGNDAALLFGGEATQCGICFGTGYVGGYTLLNGKRDIFDTSGTYLFSSILGFAIDQTAQPFKFTSPSEPNNFVEWDYEFPTYFQSAQALFLRNNTLSANNLNVLYRLYGTTDAFAPLTLDWINSRKGIPTKITIHIAPIQRVLSGRVEFTHLEIIWQYSDWPYSQMPPLGESTNFGVFDSLITTTFTLPPTMVKCDKEDVLFDYKYKRLWKVTDVTDNQTASLQVLSWQVSARIVQNYEQVNLLRLMNEQNFQLSAGRLFGPGISAPNQLGPGPTPFLDGGEFGDDGFEQNF